MKSITINPTCGRENDLISFLYGEAGENEAPDFEKHLQHCKVCKSEIASFEQLRESIGAWKQEALNGFAPLRRPSQLEVSRKKSALRGRGSRFLSRQVQAIRPDPERLAHGDAGERRGPP